MIVSGRLRQGVASRGAGAAAAGAGERGGGQDAEGGAHRHRDDRPRLRDGHDEGGERYLVGQLRSHRV